MTAARHGLSVHREESQREAEAYAKGINAVLAYLVSTGDPVDNQTAHRIRAQFSDREAGE